MANKLWEMTALLCIGSRLIFASVGIKDASTYSNHSLPQWRWAMDTLQKYPLTGTERILDVGCGDGKITAFIARQLQEGLVVGLDISPQMIGFATKAFPPTQHRNLVFIQSDATKIPFYEQFDVAISLCCLHWIQDQKTALTKIYESLVPGGTLIINTPYRSPLSCADQLIKSKKWAPYFPNYSSPRVYFNQDDYIAILSEVGFESISIESSETQSLFSDYSDFIDYLKPLVNFADHLPTDLRLEFIEELAEAMMNLFPQPLDGSVFIHHYKLEVFAKKP